MTNSNKTNPDEMVNKLFAKLQEKKKLIESLEKPRWKTNFSFGYNADSSNRINLQIVSDTDKLVEMAAFLLDKARSHKEASDLLEVKSEFKWLGFTLEEWMSDIKTRANKINIEARKKELKQLEEKLNGLVSPEQRRLMDLEAVAKALAD